MEKCIKCEHEELKVRYYQEGETDAYRSIGNREQFMRNDSYYVQDKVKKEHLVYTCQRCGYQKAEHCKDHKSK